MGGISEHFIWQVDLVEHFISKVDLILWLFQMGSHWRHRSGNSWSAVTGSFAWGVYLNLNTSSENMNSYLMSVCTSSCALHLTSSGGYIWQLICTLYLKMWTHIWCPCALHFVHFIWQLWGVHLIWALHLKIWTHFGFDSCSTEVFSTKDQQESQMAYGTANIVTETCDWAKTWNPCLL